MSTLRIGRLILVAIVAVGCGDDNSAARAADAATDAHAEARAILTAFVVEYDRRVRIQCPCQVEQGAYASVDECVELLASGPDWVDCATMALADQDSPEVRATGQCLVDQSKARNDCYMSTACGSDERVACDTIPIACPAIDPQFIILVSQKCPDTTILGTRL